MIGLLYQALANLAGPVVVLGATLKGRFGGHWRQRLGLTFYPHPNWNVPRLWVHGASVGEIKSASVVIEAILEQQPHCQVYVSAGTPAGLSTAQSIFQNQARVLPLAAPLDFWGAPGRIMTRLKPQALIIMETELWPELISQARKHQIPLMLAAGRLTQRSFKRYNLVRGFMASLLNNFELLAVSGPEEKKLFTALGAKSERLTILGNPKFDQLLVQAQSPGMVDKIHFFANKIWGSEPPNPLIVAGSTHSGEEEIIIRAFQRLLKTFPKLKLILAPRHLNRVGELLQLAQKKGLVARSISSIEQPLLSSQTQVLILDSLGDLGAIYGLGQISVVGGSLLPGLTGHNPLEPAALASPIIFGPHMSSFSTEVASLLEVDGAVETTPERLALDLDHWLKNPEKARAAGEAAKNCLMTRPAAGPALARAALSLLGPNQLKYPL